MRAQAVAPNGSDTATLTPPETLSQAELQEAYRTLHDQLRATQAAIVNTRFDAEAAARAQSAAIAEKIDAMNTTLAAERNARQSQSDRFDYERGQQQQEINRGNRAVIWIASCFGLVGLLAMAGAAYFQWRAINRIAEVVNPSSLPPSTHFALLPSLTASPSTPAVTVSTQRMMSTMERMEKRIKELEHMSAHPFPATATPPTSPVHPPQQTHDINV
ncbi:MAG: hypothetical protein ABI273_06805 [Lacunisphaera sp.]